jgi:hypothetical protein
VVVVRRGFASELVRRMPVPRRRSWSEPAPPDMRQEMAGGWYADAGDSGKWMAGEETETAGEWQPDGWSEPRIVVEALLTSMVPYRSLGSTTADEVMNEPHRSVPVLLHRSFSFQSSRGEVMRLVGVGGVGPAGSVC